MAATLGNLVGWGDQHDAKKVLENPEFRKLGIYGFARPGDNSLPLPIEQYRSQAPRRSRATIRTSPSCCDTSHRLPLGFMESTYPKGNTK